MNRLLLIFIAFILSVSTCQKKIDQVIEHTMMETEDTLTRQQLDSVFVADTLSFNIEEDWIQSSALTQDKKDFLYKYVYIKELTDSTGTIYTLCTYQDTLYILTKRIAE